MFSKKIMIPLMLIVLVSTIWACKNNWAVQVDGDSIITIDEFNDIYYFRNKAFFDKKTDAEIDEIAKNPAVIATMFANPQQMILAQKLLNKEDVLNQIVESKLIYKEAMTDDDIDQDELQIVLEMARLEAVVQYYIKKKLIEKMDISDEEIEATYNQYKSQLAGMTYDQAVRVIKERISQQKFQSEARMLVEDLKKKSKIDDKGFKDYIKTLEKETASQAPAVTEAPAPLEETK